MKVSRLEIQKAKEYRDQILGLQSSFSPTVEDNIKRLTSNALLFDIETGGLDSKSSIYEMGFMRGIGSDAQFSHHLVRPNRNAPLTSEFTNQRLAERNKALEASTGRPDAFTRAIRSDGITQREAALTAYDYFKGKDLWVQNLRFEREALNERVSSRAFNDIAKGIGLESFSRGGGVHVTPIGLKKRLAEAGRQYNVGTLDSYLNSWEDVFTKGFVPELSKPQRNMTRAFEVMDLTKSVFAMAQKRGYMAKTGDLFTGTSIDAFAKSMFGLDELHAANADNVLQGRVIHNMLGAGLLMQEGKELPEHMQKFFTNLDAALPEQRHRNAVKNIIRTFRDQQEFKASQAEGAPKWSLLEGSRLDREPDAFDLFVDTTDDGKTYRRERILQPKRASVTPGPDTQFRYTTSIDELTEAWQSQQRFGPTVDYKAALEEARASYINHYQSALGGSSSPDSIRKALASTESIAVSAREALEQASWKSAAKAPAAIEAKPANIMEQSKNFIKSNWKIGLAGAGLIVAANLISGDDDDYNYIEGMRHAGISGSSRKQNTDFGSGWRGLVDWGIHSFKKAMPKTQRVSYSREAIVGAAVRKLQDGLPSSIRRGESILKSIKASHQSGSISPEAIGLGVGASWHATSTESAKHIISTKRILPGVTNNHHENGHVGVYLFKGGSSDLTTQAGQVGAHRSDNFFFVPPGSLPLSTVENSSKQFTTDSSIKFSGVKTHTITVPAPHPQADLIINNQSRSWENALSMDRMDLAEDIERLQNKPTGLSVRTINNITSRQRRVIVNAKNAKAGIENYKETFSIHELLDPELAHFDPSQIGRPTKIVSEESGYSMAFSRAEELGFSDPKKLSAHRNVRKIAKDIEEAGGQLYIKGGVARESLVSRLRPDLKRQSKDIDLLVTGDLDVSRVYDIMERHQSFFDVQIQPDLDTFMRGADMTANQAVLKVPTKSGQHHKLLHTKAAAADIAAGDIRYLDSSDPERAAQRIEKFKSYYPGVQISPGRISSSDDAYNIIEGLGHPGGVSDTVARRKKLTDFGSGVDPLRAILRNLEINSGKSLDFEKMTRSSELFNVLSRGREVGYLGEGSFGVATLMEHTIGGQNLRYVRKQAHLDGTEFDLLAREFGEERARKELTRSIGIEAGALRQLHGMEATPSVYGQQGHTMFMELMPGSPVNQLREQPPGLLPRMVQNIAEAAQKGVANTDVAARNILYDSRSDRLSWIDFGLATPHKPGAPFTQRQIDKISAELGSAFRTGSNKVESQLSSAGITTSTPEIGYFGSSSSIPGRPTSNTSGNIIHGFADSATASSRRMQNTKGQFGSPWRGIINLGDELGELFGKVHPAAGFVPEKGGNFATRSGWLKFKDSLHEVSNAREAAGFSGSSDYLELANFLGSDRSQKFFSDLDAAEKAGKTPIFINPRVMAAEAGDAKAARGLWGEEYVSEHSSLYGSSTPESIKRKMSQNLRGTIKHERFHQTGGGMARTGSTPEGWSQLMGEAYPEAHLHEEYLAWRHQHEHYPESISDTKAQAFFNNLLEKEGNPITPAMRRAKNRTRYLEKKTRGPLVAGRPASNTEHNTIQGFQEESPITGQKGFGAKLRKLFGFGSPWQGLRYIADDLVAIPSEQYAIYNAREEKKRKKEQASGNPEGINPYFGGEALATVGVDDYSVEDADTIKLFMGNGQTTSMRLAGIDAPEIEHEGQEGKIWPNQPYGQEAKAKLQELLAKQSNIQAVIDPRATETYGRPVGMLIGDNGQNLNLELVKSGAAASLPYGKRSDQIFDSTQFKRAERDAVAAQTGMWSTDEWNIAREAQLNNKRRITNVSYTDLGRLFKDFKTSSVLNRMRNPDAEFSDMQASGGRDDFNVIEGMRHGWIGANRTLNTDFGSPYKINTKTIPRIPRSYHAKRRVIEGQYAANTQLRRSMKRESYMNHHKG